MNGHDQPGSTRRERRARTGRRPSTRSGISRAVIGRSRSSSGMALVTACAAAHRDPRRRSSASWPSRPSGSTTSRPPACSCCWPWASTSSWAWPDCSTWATRRSSPSVPTPTRTAASTFTDLHIPFWLMLPIGAVVAAVFGILLGAPTLRLRGDYLAIVTLGFGEIVPIVFRNADLDQGHRRHRRHRPARACCRSGWRYASAPQSRSRTTSSWPCSSPS